MRTWRKLALLLGAGTFELTPALRTTDKSGVSDHVNPSEIIDLPAINYVDPKKGEDPAKEEEALQSPHMGQIPEPRPKSAQERPGIADAADIGQWVAGIWGGCIDGCGGQPIKYRSVGCYSQFTGDPLEWWKCQLEKPINSKHCDCGLEVCSMKRNHEDCPAIDGVVPNHTIRTSYSWMGCYEFQKPDLEADQLEVSDDPFFDMTCRNWTRENEPCNGGLPFYAYIVKERIRRGTTLGSWTCYEFCLRKGFDVSGVEYGKTCRCGASPINKIWGPAHQRSGWWRPGLIFRPSELTPTDKTGFDCPMMVMRYDGMFQDDLIPHNLWRVSADDTEYIDSVRGAGHRYELDEEVTASDDLLDLADTTGHSKVPTWQRVDCTKHKCGFGERWSFRTVAAPSGVQDRYEEYVEVWYRFEPKTTQMEKDAFRLAAEQFLRHTCIIWKEVSTPPLDEKIPWVRVGTWFDHIPCNVKQIKPDDVYMLQFELGYCGTDMRHYGMILNRMMHLLGQRAEHKRKDAIEQYHNKGPHLKVLWQNFSPMTGLDKDWFLHQTEDDYMGSVGEGYAPYDFDSIMHEAHGWGRKQKFIPLPSSALPRVGQRMGLSKGDINQLNDVYRCTKVRLAPPPTDPFPEPHRLIKIGALSGGLIGVVLGSFWNTLGLLKPVAGYFLGWAIGGSLGYRMDREGRATWEDWWKTFLPLWRD